MSQASNAVTILVDSSEFEVPKTLSGGQIKALVQKDIRYQLFKEGDGKEPDQAVRDEDSLSLTNRMRFYTVPPAAFGR